MTNNKIFWMSLVFAFLSGCGSDSEQELLNQDSTSMEEATNMNGSTNNRMDMSESGMPSMGNSDEMSMSMTPGGMMIMTNAPHLSTQIPEGLPLPQLELDLITDKMSGFNLHIEYNLFRISSPDLYDQEKDAEEMTVAGHAHLFINGEKVQRVYGRYLHLDAKYFIRGINQITVTLNDHDHSVWSKNNKPVFATFFVNTERKPMIQHYMSTSPID